MTSPRVTVQQAWDALAEGNERFMAGDLRHPQQNAARRSELRGSQAPNAAFLGCSDSRVGAFAATGEGAQPSYPSAQDLLPELDEA